MRYRWVKLRSASLSFFTLLAAGLASGCTGEPGTSPASPAAAVFTDVARQAGISHRHHKPVLDRQIDNIMPWMASVGAAVGAEDFVAS